METGTGAKPKNLLTSEVAIKGEVNFSGDLYFDGKLEGSVKGDGNLILGENAQIQGDMSTGNVMIQGKVNGNVTASQKIILKSKSEVHGDLTAAFLIMEDGVTFVGKLDVNPSRAPAGTVPPAGAAAGGAAERPVQPARPVEPGSEGLPSPVRPRPPGTFVRPESGDSRQAQPQGGPKIPTGPRREG
jgi:cytoskeletal protein CcmA (bactofilin family)